MVGALKIPAADASATRIFGHNQSPFFAVSDQPTPTNQDAGRRIKRPIRLLPAIPTLIRCPPLSFACNPSYQFLRKTSRKSLVRFVLSHPKLPRRPLLGGLQMQICLDSDFLIFAAIKVKFFYVSALPRWAIGSAIKPDVPCWILKFCFYGKQIDDESLCLYQNILISNFGKIQDKFRPIFLPQYKKNNCVSQRWKIKYHLVNPCCGNPPKILNFIKRDKQTGENLKTHTRPLTN